MPDPEEKLKFRRVLRKESFDIYEYKREKDLLVDNPTLYHRLGKQDEEDFQRGIRIKRAWPFVHWLLEREYLIVKIARWVAAISILISVESLVYLIWGFPAAFMTYLGFLLAFIIAGVWIYRES